MALRISDGSNQIRINSVAFDNESNSFLCCEEEDSGSVFTFDLPFVLSEMPDPSLTEKIYLFKNHLLNNNRLLKLKIKEKPEQNKLVGYIFSLNAIIENPSIFENVHLQKIAFNVLNKLLKEENISLFANIPAYRTDSSYILTDFYDDDLIVVVVCDQLVSFPNYSFESYLPSLYKLGFRMAPHFNFYPETSDCQSIKNNYDQLVSAVTVSLPKTELYLNYFILSLIKNELFLKENEVARFHIYYQVIEMLLEKVYKNEVKNRVITTFNNLSAFDVKELLRDTMRDIYSLEKLLGTNYSKIENDILDELDLTIDTFLKYIGTLTDTKSTSVKIYKVRNTLFHGYSKILGDPKLDKARVSKFMKAINDSFEYLIIDLIVSYHDHIPNTVK
jgi:hypothetical protein